MTDNRITHDEMFLMFGPLIPMEAITIIMEPGQTVEGARERLRTLAAQPKPDTTAGQHLVERLRDWPAAGGHDGLSSSYVEGLMHEAATEIDRLREALGRALRWMETPHCKDWWRGNEAFQADLRSIKELLPKRAATEQVSSAILAGGPK